MHYNNSKENFGHGSVDPNKFTDDYRIKKAPQEPVKHAKLIRQLANIISIVIIAGIFWLITHI